MFDYEVLTEQEAMQQRFNLLEKGEYEGEIKQVEFRTSSIGNPMFEVTINVYDNNGCQHTIKDFLLFTKNMIWKTIHCAEATGTEKEYQEKKFSPELLIGKYVRVLVGTKQGTEIPHDKLNGKPVGSRYYDKNVIEDYLKKGANVTTNTPNIVDTLNDDLPF